MSILPLDSVVELTTWGRSQRQVACDFKGSQSFSKLLLKCSKQLKVFPAASQGSGSTCTCGRALLFSKCFFSDLFSSSSNLRKYEHFSCFQHAKELFMWNCKVWCLQLEKLLKKLRARLILVVLVFGYVLVWMYCMWSEDLRPDSLVTVIADWFFGAVLQGKEPSQVCDGYSEVLLALKVVDCTAARPVTQPVFQFSPRTCKEVKNLCWSDFLGGSPGSEILWCLSGKHRGGGAGIKNAVILPSHHPPLPKSYFLIYLYFGWKMEDFFKI